MMGDLLTNMIPRVAHQQYREDEPKQRVTDPEIDRLRAKTVVLGNIAGEEGREADRRDSLRIH